MRHRDGYILRRVGEKYIVLPVSEDARNVGAALQMNESGALLWVLLDEETTQEALVLALREEFDIDEDSAVRDAAAFVEKLRGNGLLIT
ncbi:MAG: PqqD family protein [Clostridiales bacterium]|nr:PqqD family protein [Clostridiales bacterium]